MTDTAQATVVPAPAEASPGTATPAPIQDGAAAANPTPAPTNAREFRQSLRDRIVARQADAVTVGAPAEPVAEVATSEAAPEPVVDATGRAHDPATGKFLPSGEVATPEAAPAPEGLVRIELPEGHPLRERGRTHYEVRITSPEEEAEIRGLIATPVKQRELREARERIAQMEEQLLRSQAETAARQKWEQGLSPEIREKLAAVEAVDPETAALMRRGLEAALPELAETEFRTLAEERTQAEVAREVESFRQRAHGAASTVYADIASAPYFPDLLRRAEAAYGAELMAREARGDASPHSEAEFLQFLRPFIVAHPEAAGVIRQRVEAQRQAEREQAAAEAKAKAEAEAKQREAERLSAALQNRRTNPLGGVAMGVTTGAQSVPGEARPVSAHDARRTLRDRMRTGV